MNDIILYHGSRGGLDGAIKPISRERCDFGKGFYMGEDISQVKGLIVDSFDPVLYKVKFNLSKIPEDKILVLSEKDWIYTVLANRKRVEEFNNLHIASTILQSMNNYDVIIGPIADDRMNIAMQEFSNSTITDEGLKACLQYVNYGRQFVAKTEFACSQIEILSERNIELEEMNEIRNYSLQQREIAKNAIKTMRIQYRNQGFYIDEIIKNEKLIEPSMTMLNGKGINNSNTTNDALEDELGTDERDFEPGDD